MPKVHFRANGTIARGYLVIPAELPAPATVVLQEWWGVDDHIRSVCDRFAAEGASSRWHRTCTAVTWRPSPARPSRR